MCMYIVVFFYFLYNMGLNVKRNCVPCKNVIYFPALSLPFVSSTFILAWMPMFASQSVSFILKYCISYLLLNVNLKKKRKKKKKSELPP